MRFERLIGYGVFLAAYLFIMSVAMLGGWSTPTLSNLGGARAEMMQGAFPPVAEGAVFEQISQRR